MTTADPLAGLARAWPAPSARGRTRVQPEDFRVEENSGFQPDGKGVHAWLKIRKRNLNTEDVARRLIRLAGVRAVDVGYAGLKDRHAVTTQWFSVDLSGRTEPDWSRIENDEVRIVQATRHGRKLRRGMLKENRFEILVRDLRGDRDRLTRRLLDVAARGVPNYFGAQRFGREGRNVQRAREMLSGGLKVRDRGKRGLYLSSARSYLFNEVLSRRVAEGCWDRPRGGDVFVLAGSRSIFQAHAVDEEIEHRVGVMDIHPSGPLWGRGHLPVSGEARSIEEEALAAHDDLKAGLEAFGLRQERRPLRLAVASLTWSFEADNVLMLRFGLPAGSYATAVLREIVDAANSLAPETAATSVAK